MNVIVESEQAPKARIAAPEVSIIVPTYNERGNVAPLVDAVTKAMGDIPWEMIVVDDDSPDHTFAEVSRISREEPRLRCLRRVGRRGLASAVIEGALVAIGADIVVATRYAEGGGIGEWDATRARMSDFATR